MMMMKVWLFLAGILSSLLLAACGSAEMIPPLQPSPVALTRTSPAMNATQPAKTAPPTARPTQPPAATATQPAIKVTPIVLTSGGLTIRIDSPADGSTLKTSPVEVKGLAPAGTVISIDDVVLVVKADRVFSARIDLKEGPNLVEVVGSDATGNQVYYELALYYEP